MSPERATLDEIVPVPLLGTVLAMLVALVVLRVRAARSGRSGPAPGRDSGAAGRVARGNSLDLPRDPAEALAALKSRSDPHA